FFISSSRRHTRFSRDWSSDVCSSGLAIAERESVRAEIAAKVAAYEAEHGSIETLPIRTDDKRMPYRISCPEKKLSVEAAKAKGQIGRASCRERASSGPQGGTGVPGRA